MQSAILLLFTACSSLPPCGFQSTHPTMPCYISPYVVYNAYGALFVNVDNNLVWLCSRLRGLSPSRRRAAVFYYVSREFESFLEVVF